MMISDTIVRHLFQQIQNHEIVHGKKVYIFRLRTGRLQEISATNENEAREVVEARGDDVVELVRTESPSYHGLSYHEIIVEAQKRGLDYE